MVIRDFEVGQAPGRNPRVVLAERSRTSLHQIGSEELGERRRHRDRPRLRPRQLDVVGDRLAHTRDDVPRVPRFLAREPGRFRQPQPGLNAAFAGGGSVLVHEPLPPDAAHVRLGAVRDDRSILHRQVTLVMKTVGDPAANLRRSELPFIHQPMEGMAIVIAFLADGPQLRGEGLSIPEFGVFVGHRSCPARSHSSISNPS